MIWTHSGIFFFFLKLVIKCESKTSLFTNLVSNLIDSKSDPQCVVHMKSTLADNYREIGRTEVIQDNLNPDFVKKFPLDYNFETGTVKNW